MTVTVSGPSLGGAVAAPAAGGRAERAASSESSTPTEANVLWTGGWDSTFRVLQILLFWKHSVQPFYVLDPRRRSSLLELQAMQSIRDRIADRDREAAGRLKPLRLVTTYDVLEDPASAARLRALRTRAHVGHQYEFLARYAAQAQLDDLELSVQAHNKPARDGPLYFLRDHIIRVEDANGGHWRLDPQAIAADPDLVLFARFRFPLLETTKLQMREAAGAMGILDIMEGTWFCHTPVAERPCGRCPPCIRVIEEGMRDRVPRRALLRYYGRSLERVSNLGERTIRAVMRPRTILARLRARAR